jgi:anti-sigma regulatory factor (Ser/Thr protein kinase)
VRLLDCFPGVAGIHKAIESKLLPKRSLQVRMSLDLPDDAATVPLCRPMLGVALINLGVPVERAAALALLLSEAANSVKQYATAHPDHCYEVEIVVNAERLRFLVNNKADGVLPRSGPEPESEWRIGRGLELVEQLASRVSFATVKGSGGRFEAEFDLR